MANVSWDDYLPEVLLSAEGVPYDIAINGIRDAAIEFCEETGVWREDLDPINIVVGVNDYDLDIPDQAQVVNLTWATRDGTDLNLTNENELDTAFNQYRVQGWRTRTGDPTDIYMLDEWTARLVPIPITAVTDGLKVGAILRPSEDAYEGPEKLYSHYKQAIVNGALSFILDQVGRDWYKPQVADKNRVKFAMKKNRYRIRKNKGGTRSGNQILQRPMA